MSRFVHSYPLQEFMRFLRFVANKTIFIFILMHSANTTFAGNNDPALTAQTKSWLSTQNESGFLENQGQMTDGNNKPVSFVLFKAEAPGLNIWITEKGITLQTLELRKEPIPESELSEWEKEEAKRTGKPKTKKIFDWERIDVELKGASIKKENISKEKSKQGHSNYFYPHCPDGIYEVKEHEKITIKNVYPGIDWVWYSHPEKGYKYDFIVNPGADYRQIELLYKSKTPVKINEQGELELYTQYGNIKENTPVSFYEGKEVETKFKLNVQKPVSINGDKGYETSVSFDLGTLNLQHSTLIIDPQLNWASFYGGSASADGLMSITTDVPGNVFVTGYTVSSNFPVQNAGTFFQGTLGGSMNVFILKFNNAGVRIWATYYGGSGSDHGYSIVTDASGNVFVTGQTDSPNFPVQNAGTFYQGTLGGFLNAFILKFNNAGTRLWATYYGGNWADYGYSIATDASGNVFVTGYTGSSNFPVQNAGTYFDGTLGGTNDIFILKFNNAGTRLWATYYGGSESDYGYSMATDPSGNVFITGVTDSPNFPVQNAGTFFQGTLVGFVNTFVLKFNNTGTRLWATYYGGSGINYGYSIATDASGNVFVTGITDSPNFPVQNAGTFFQGTFGGGFNDAFILKFSNTGTRLWATYYGGTGDEAFDSYDNLTRDNCGNIYITFGTGPAPSPYLTNSCDAGYYDNSLNGGVNDILLSLFNNTGTLLWCTYVGGNGNDFRSPIAVDGNSNLFMAGEWSNVINSATYPVINPGGAYYDATFNGGGDDGFLAKFCSNACICSPYSSCIVVLPIELVSFSGNCENSKEIKLQWQTATEINNDYFSIERAMDTGQGLNWVVIGTVDGAGNSSVANNYEFIDSDMGAGPRYYRLKQVDYNGSSTYHGPISISCEPNDEWNIILQSNPVADELLITLLAPLDMQVQVSIIDVRGRYITNQAFLANKGSNLLQFNLATISGGLYLIQISNSKVAMSKKFIKQ